MAKEPIYERIRADLAASIAREEYPRGVRIPSETALAERYGVTRMTVRRAIDGLVNEGLLSRRQGAGTFVVEARSAGRPLNRLTSFSEDMSAEGRELRTVVLSQESVEPPDDVRSHLALEAGTHTVRLIRIRYVDGDPVALHHAWVPLGCCPGLDRASMGSGSLYETLEREWGIRLLRAKQQISATAADGELAAKLAVPVGSPLLYAERLTYDTNNTPIEFVRTWTRPGLPLLIELKR